MKRIFAFILFLSPIIALSSIADDTWTVAGSNTTLLGSEWNPADGNNDMPYIGHKNDNGTPRYYHILSIYSTTAQSVDFKVCKNHGWGEAYPSSNAWASFTGNGYATIIFETIGKNITTRTESSYNVAGSTGGDSGETDDLFGSAWDPSLQENQMTRVSNTEYTLTKSNIRLQAGTIEYKVCANGSWDGLSYSDTDNLDANATLTINNESYYDVTFTFNPITKRASVTATEVFNSAVVNNVDGLDDIIDATMTQSGTTFTYTKQGIVLPKGTYWYNIGVNGISDRTFPESGNASLSIPARAKYNITFTFDTATKAVNATYEVAEDFNNTVETYFVNKKNWENVYCYVWLNDKCFTAPWPGDQCVKTDMTETVDGVEYEVWKWTYNVESIEDVPDGIIFNDGIAAQDVTDENRNQHQTQDQYFVNKGMFIYYDYNNEDYQVKNNNVYKVTIPDAGSNKNHDFDFYLQSDVIAATLSYDRTFTVGQVSTVCLPFALTAAEVTAAGSFYQLKSFDNGENSAKVTFEPVTTTIAYRPYLFVAKTATPFIALSDKTIKESTGLLHKHTVDGVSFVGVLERTTVISNSQNSYYGFSGGKYKKAGTTTGASFNPFRAYLEVSTAASGAKDFFDVDYENITGIKTMHNEECIMQNDSAVYDLQGRKVNENANAQLSTLKPGVYIINGKKILLK